MNKRGDLTSTQVVSFIIIAISLVVLIFFVMFLFDDPWEKERGACQISVLTRATVPSIVQQDLPLKCYTEKICITSEAGGKCEQFYGEEKVSTIRLKGNAGINDVNYARAIEKIMADRMYYCWSMMGEGKLDLFGSRTDVLGWGNPKEQSSCVICSRVAFGKDIIDKGLLEKVDLRSYLENNNPPNKRMSYIEAFTNYGMSSFPSVEKINEIKSEVGEDTTNYIYDGNQVAFVFAQAKSPRWQEVGENWFKLGAGATVAVAGAGGVINPLALKVAAVTAVGAGVVGGVSTYNAYQNQEAATMYCGEIIGVAGAETGCSIVQSVPYNVANINKLCTGSIQSIP